MKEKKYDDLLDIVNKSYGDPGNREGAYFVGLTDVPGGFTKQEQIYKVASSSLCLLIKRESGSVSEEEFNRFLQTLDQEAIDYWRKTGYGLFPPLIKKYRRGRSLTWWWPWGK
jgi:hypothetical protein